jgi:hypothetical protein
MARPGEHLHPVPAGQLQGLLTSAAAPGRWSEAARVEGVPSPPAPTAARCRIIRRGRNASGQPLYRHAIGDQRRREVCECGAQDPGRIGQLRVDGEPFGQQESRPAHSRVLSRFPGPDRSQFPLSPPPPPPRARCHHDQAVLAAVAQALQRRRADVGTAEGGRQLPSRSHVREREHVPGKV